MNDLARKNVSKAVNYAALFTSITGVITSDLLGAWHIPADTQTIILKTLVSVVTAVNIWANWEKNTDSLQQ